MSNFFFSFLTITLCLSGDPTLTRINDGLIQGELFDDVLLWRTIPYASPPIDELRWSQPQPPIPWNNNTLKTNTDPPGCIQSCGLPPHTCPTIVSEDCLYLNVFKPTTTQPIDGFPVMVFIHGGDYNMGYSGGLLYNGTNMVKLGNIILVTINYRLGALGFLWSLTGPSGNYGIMDQILALHWVQDNIGYFGGNNKKVTIFGQSAGAVSVATIMAYSYPNNLNLFQAAIMESEPFGIPIRDTVTWGTLPNNFYSFLGCDYDKFSRNEEQFWECLRGKNASEILYAQSKAETNALNEFDHFWDIFMCWTPTAGTDLIPKQTFWEFQSNNYVDVPYVTGLVRNEGVLFVQGSFPNPMSYSELIGLMEILLGTDDTLKILNKYPPPKNVTDYRDYASMVTTYGLFWCPTWNVTLGGLSGKQKNNRWFYHFNRVSSFNANVWGPHNQYCDPVVCHGGELPYVFHPSLAPDNTTYDADEDILAEQMQTFWTNFAKNYDVGTSNVGYNLNWPKFEENKQSTMMLDTPQSQIINNYDAANCEFWNSLNYNWIK